jgi:hypothetical protein
VAGVAAGVVVVVVLVLDEVIAALSVADFSPPQAPRTAAPAMSAML